MGKANHENNENWMPTNKKYFTVSDSEAFGTPLDLSLTDHSIRLWSIWHTSWLITYWSQYPTLKHLVHLLIYHLLITVSDFEAFGTPLDLSLTDHSIQLWSIWHTSWLITYWSQYPTLRHLVHLLTYHLLITVSDFEAFGTPLEFISLLTGPSTRWTSGGSLIRH